MKSEIVSRVSGYRIDRAREKLGRLGLRSLSKQRRKAFSKFGAVAGQEVINVQIYRVCRILIGQKSDNETIDCQAGK